MTMKKQARRIGLCTVVFGAPSSFHLRRAAANAPSFYSRWRDASRVAHQRELLHSRGQTRSKCLNVEKGLGYIQGENRQMEDALW